MNKGKTADTALSAAGKLIKVIKHQTVGIMRRIKINVHLIKNLQKKEKRTLVQAIQQQKIIIIQALLQIQLQQTSQLRRKIISVIIVKEMGILKIVVLNSYRNYWGKCKIRQLLIHQMLHCYATAHVY
jgi:hypothetical protein